MQRRLILIPENSISAGKLCLSISPAALRFTFVWVECTDYLLELLHYLRVRLIRSKQLDKYTSRANTYFGIGYPFGQLEELTRRVQNIIREYAMDESVSKELLHNTDDAKATKICTSFLTNALGMNTKHGFRQNSIFLKTWIQHRYIPLIINTEPEWGKHVMAPVLMKLLTCVDDLIPGLYAK